MLHVCTPKKDAPTGRLTCTWDKDSSAGGSPVPLAQDLLQQPLHAPVGQTVIHEQAVLAGCYHLGLPQHPQLLGDVGLWPPQHCLQVTDAGLVAPQFVQDAQPGLMGYYLE